MMEGTSDRTRIDVLFDLLSTNKRGSSGCEVNQLGEAYNQPALSLEWDPLLPDH